MTDTLNKFREMNHRVEFLMTHAEAYSVASYTGQIKRLNHLKCEMSLANERVITHLSFS